MPSSPSRHLRPLIQYGHLAPYSVLAFYGLLVLAGWWAGAVTLVQPRSYDAVLPANAALCLILIGLTPVIVQVGWKRTGLALGFAASLLGLATMLQDPLGVDFGLDELLVQHGSLVAGAHVARMPFALAGTCALSALLVTWLAARPRNARLPLLLGVTGSLVLAYALTGLLGFRSGLNDVPAWRTYALLGPHTAAALLVLGAALVTQAAREHYASTRTGPRWLWLPVTACGIAVTLSFWVTLRERELAFTHNTTQLTMDYIASLLSGETESKVQSLARLAARSSLSDKLSWEREAAGQVRDFEGYRSIQRIDANRRTIWYWPLEGNEDAPSYDHGTDALRLAAIESSRRTGGIGVAAPLQMRERAPTFAVYLPVAATRDFVVGEFYYDKFFEIIERRLDITRRYQTVISVDLPTGPAGLTVFETPTGQDTLDTRLSRTAHYNILDQHFTIRLTPRPVFVGASRHYLPELTLFSGFGVSALLGLVINLAQAALRRQRAAESTSQLLQVENAERRRAEARLKTADERLNLAFESTLAGVYEWDIETDEVYCTPSIWKMIGAGPGSMPTTGAGWLALLHDDDRSAVRAVIDAHFRGETPLIEIEHCVHLASGEWLWIALRAKCTTFSAARHPRRLLGTVQNINARKRTDEALRYSQAESRKLSLVASKTDNAVIITDPQGLIEWTNESHSRLTGRLLAQVVHRPLLSFLGNPADDSTVVDRIAAALATGEPISTEAIQLATEDHQFHVHLDLQPVANDDGQIEHFIVIATDITARVETEQQLRRAKQEADDASRAKSEFLAAMSHEIRTPMNGVIGMTSLLLDTDLTPEQRDYVSTIRTSGDALLSIINEILDFSKIESGKMEIESHPFELTQCVEEVVDIFAAQAAAKGIELACFIDPRVPPCVLGDITRLRQILVNLANNAVKFTSRGFITIEVGTLLTEPPAGGRFHLDFQVTDTGIGIPPDRYNLLFKPFSQIDASTTRKYGGTGLGLAICHRLCEMMGGRIGVQSKPGEGSRFHFTIATEAVPLPDNHLPLFPPLPGNGVVLAVDDLPVNRSQLGLCLSNWSLQPRLAGTVAEALAIAADTPLTAAIIDYDLAGTPGLELINQLRTAHPKLPIVLLAAAHGSQKRDLSLDPLVFRLPKPIKPYALHDTLRRVIAGAVAQNGVAVSTAPFIRFSSTIPLAILLVEDNPVNQKVALGLLDRLGYKADSVANGFEAIAAVEKRKFDLVLMDLQMPEMDGLTATREIRRSLPAERQPVIFALTANAMPGDRELCLEAGMNDHLPKPIKSDDIQQAILRHFKAKGA